MSAAQRLVLIGVVVLALGAAAFFLLQAPSSDPADAGEVVETAAPVPPAPGELGALGAGSGEIARDAAEIPEADGSAATADSAAGRAAAEVPAAWFRGQLRIVEGTLPTPPRLRATLSPAPDALSATHSTVVKPGELTFEIPSALQDSQCDVELPSFLVPVAVHGPAQLDGEKLHFPQPADGVIVDVEVRPHAGVLFLHDPSGEPLAGANAWSEMNDGEGSSTSWGETLDADGMLYFDFARIADFEAAKTIFFSVSRPPDIGTSRSPDYATADLPLMPQPIVLRFASSQPLHFLVQDTKGKPVAGATVRIGGRDDSAPSGEDGKITAAQTTPASEDFVAEAPGFVGATLAISPAAAREQLIVLAPASWIELVGQQMPPGGWDELDAEFRFDGKADASSIIGERFQPGRIRESAGGVSSSYNRDSLQFQIRTSFSSEGRVLLDGIHADVPATVRVTYRGQTLLEQRVPLQPGDGGHHVDLPPLPEFVPLRGTVVDSSGAPLAGVRVRSNSGWHGATSAETDAHGVFDLGVIGQGATVQLGFSMAGRGRHQLEYTGLSGDADSVGVVTLGATRALTVQLLAEDGVPFVPLAGTNGVRARPVLEFFGEEIAPAAQGAGAGEWLFEDLPAGPLQFVMQSGRGYGLQEFNVLTTDPRVALHLNAETLVQLRAPE